MQVPTLEQHEKLTSLVEQMEAKLELISLALSFANWVSHTEAQRILNVTRPAVLHDMKKRGEIQMRAVSDRKYEVSLLSIASLLIKKGYTLQGVQERIAA
jgi:hypothetical protein